MESKRIDCGAAIRDIVALQGVDFEASTTRGSTYNFMAPKSLTAIYDVNVMTTSRTDTGPKTVRQND